MERCPSPNLTLADSDFDGLNDGAEINKFSTNPLDPDTDNGGRSDGDEVNLDSTDPLDPSDDVNPVFAGGCHRTRDLAAKILTA